MTGTVDCNWIQPLDDRPQLNSGIMIWYGHTDELTGQYDTCYDLLNADEKAKAQRFHRSADRERYVIQHGYLRQLLGRGAGLSAETFSFTFGPNKKPYLAGRDDLYFNLSNSSGHFLIAIAHTEIGVDIEVINPDINYKDIAKSYFGAEELRFIETATDPAKAFFLLWTRKEALLKACGLGIDDDLPAVPALDGLHNLPGKYPVKQWSTGSFAIGSSVMVSLTCTEAKIPVQIARLNSGGF